MSERTGYATGTPSWVDLMTTDAEAARQFYGELFGWEFMISEEEEFAGYTTCTKRGLNVAGLGSPPAEGAPPAWTTYLATDDVEAAAERITGAGGTVLAPPMKVGDYGSMCIAMDSTGAVFGLWQAGDMIGAQLVNEPGSFTWNELATRDLAAAQDFYTKVCSYDYEAVDTGEAGPPYFTFSVDGQAVGGMQQMASSMPAEMPAHWATYFAVEDADATAAKAVELGATVLMPPMDTPFGRWTIIKDPQGATFSAMTATPDAR